MEMDIPKAGDPPLAKISGIQFGLMTSDDIYTLSIYEIDNPVTKTKDLADPKLGLPLGKGTCGTCNAETVNQCQGHFAHCLLPTPIFHPSHVGKLVALLRKICLNCGQPKKKKTGQLPSLLLPALKKEQHEFLAPKVEQENVSIPTEGREGVSNPTEGRDGVIVLSSDEEDDSSSARSKRAKMRSLKTGQIVESDGDDDEEMPDTPAGRRSWNFRKRKSRADSTENSTVTEPVIDLAESYDLASTSKLGKRKRAEQGRDPQPNPVADDEKPVGVNPDAARGKCKYCSGSGKYPEVLVKVEVIERGKYNSLSSKAIKMEYKLREKDMGSVPADYWSFVEKNSRRRASDFAKNSRFLLPSEALNILKKIPASAFERLGMHSKVARPEALVIECVPVPPNCSRIQEDVYKTNNLEFRRGTDRATLVLSKIINKISAIKGSRYGKPTFVAADVEAGELQSLFGQYLREKGAAKAVPGKERQKIDHGGRVSKVASRWSLEWMKDNVLGKRGSYCAWTVVTGDPYLRVEEIGIPQKIAKYVTVPERVNRLNMEKLQDYINVGQTHFGRYRACGAVRLFRGDEQFEVTRKSSHELQIGDVVHRHLKDGDLVYVNRNPSLSKTSLLALRVHVQDFEVFTINPTTIGPLNGDFDGDHISIFVPQCEEAKAEVHQLMTIPEQLLPSPNGKTIVGMSQDNTLATHLLTSAPVFLSKEEMHQMGMWSTRQLPIPAIVKSKKDGPLWTGKQVIDLTIPEDFSMISKDGTVDIRDGELLSYDGKKNWLTSTNGLMRALALNNSPFAAVQHLDCAQSALREWLLSRGFSVSLGDFYAAPDFHSRRKMIDELMDNVTEAHNMAVNRELLFDEQYQKLEAVQPEIDIAYPEDTKQVEVLEDISVRYFRQQFQEMGEAFESQISGDNQLFAMVRSGSAKKGLTRVLEQIGCLGLQLCKGEHLLQLSSSERLRNLASSMCCEERWEARGLVRSSLLDGLDPLEFYLSSIAMRGAMFRKSLEVTKPGQLFKSLMLFLRDVHGCYDGTVRNKGGMEIIQFPHDGVKTSTSADDGVKTSTSEDNATDRKEYLEPVVPGEPVGIVAATAVAKPAYQDMIDASHNVGAKKITPLALIQETVSARSGSKLKACDRRTILRLKPCSGGEERRALSIKNELQPASVEMVAKAVMIEYVPEESLQWNAFLDDGVKLRHPWVGHILLDANAMNQIGLRMETVVSVLETAFTTMSYKRVMGSHYLAHPVFFSGTDCDGMRAAGHSNDSGPCLHFTASLKSKTSKKLASRSNKKILEFLDAMRDVLTPLIFKTIVKGDERIESAKLVWEDAAWSPSRVSDDGERIPADPNGELVVEVVVQEKHGSTRGSPWNVTKEACGLIDGIAWERSSPYSVQEVRHSLGVEAARDCILQRLALANQATGSSVIYTHLKLLSDLMVFSGEVNAITFPGYKDMLRSLKTSAPFSSGAFQAPVTTFMAAGERGAEEFLGGVLASSIFGKRVPVGTGADFSVQLQPKVLSENLQLPTESVDIFDYLTNLNSKIKEAFPEESAAAEAAVAAVAAEDIYTGEDTTEWANASGKGGEWGSPAAEDTSTREPNEWANPSAKGGEWGSPAAEDISIKETNEWAADANGGEWGSPAPVADPVVADWVMSTGPQASGLEDGPGCVDPSPAEAMDWLASPAKDVPAANGHGGSASAEPSDWDTDMTTEKETNDGGWSVAEETPAASSVWDADQPLPAQEAGAWGSSAPADAPWGVSNPPSRRDEPAPKPAFKPTGANTVPLGKMRVFGPKVVGAGSDSVNATPTPMALDTAVGANKENGTADTLKPAGDDDGDDGWSEPVGEVTQESNWEVQESGTDAGWGSLDSTQTSTGGLRSPADVPSTPGWSRRWPQDTVRNYGPTGRSLTAPVGRALDCRKDLKEWEDIIDIVRSVRDVLLNHEPEQKLKGEDHDLLMTRVLPHHPSSATKVGCGVDYLKVAHYKRTNPMERPTKCFFLVRTDGTEEDFSYHKCLQALAAKNDPPLDDLYEIGFMRKY